MINKKTLIIGGVLILLLGVFVQAAGVATPYWKDNPLLLSTGERNTVILYLQNTGDELMTVEAVISSEGNIASLKETIYEIGPGEIDVPVEVEVVVPKDIETGATYQVSISFNQIAAGEGMVSVASAFSTSFPVYVVPKEESVLYKGPSSGIPWAVIIPILILGVLVLLFVGVKRVRNKKSSKKFK